MPQRLLPGTRVSYRSHRGAHPATVLRLFSLIGDSTPRARVRLDCGPVVTVEAAALEGAV